MMKTSRIYEVNSKVHKAHKTMRNIRMEREKAEISMEIYKTLIAASSDLRLRYVDITFDGSSLVIQGPAPLFYKVALKDDGFYYETLLGLEEHKTSQSGDAEDFFALVCESFGDWIEAQRHRDCLDMSYRKIIFNGEVLDRSQNIWKLAELWNQLVTDAGLPHLEIKRDEAEPTKAELDFLWEFTLGIGKMGWARRGRSVQMA